MKSITRLFPALRSSNYRRYFAANLISFTGTWMYRVAFGYLVYDVTKSAVWVGAVGALSFAPSLFLSLYAGAIVDRVNKKKFIMITQSFQGILVAVFGVLYFSGVVNPWLIAAFATLLGIADTFDLPARQSYVVRMVTKEQLSSAIALNGTAFNTARVIGPAIAGVALVWFGISGILFVNAASFFAVVVAIYSMNINEVSGGSTTHPLKAIKEGVAYVFNHSVIRPIIFLTIVSSIFGWPYATLLPVYSKDILKQGATGLGYLYSSVGVGAVIGSLMTSALSRRFGTVKFVFAGMFLTGFFIAALSFVNSYIVALVVICFVGFGLILTFSMLNATVQLHVEDEFRGRAMSIYSMMFVGVGAIGAMIMGVLSEWLGIRVAFFASGSTLFVATLFALRGNKHLII